MKIFINFLLVLFFSFSLKVEANIFSNLSDADRLSLRNEIREFLLSNPEIIIEAVQQLENKKTQNQKLSDASLVQSNYEELFNDKGSWIGGNPNGDITIIEFLDYRCGYCRKAHNTIQKLIRSDENIKLIIKEYPILGEQSTLAARLAISVLQQSGPLKYELLHKKLMTKNISLDQQNIQKILKDLKITPNDVINHLYSKEVTETLKSTRALGQKLKISGTPTFIIEENIIRGYVNFDQMKEIIKEIR